jgi:16S rRNA (cytidine1402-2'-O)-methyltransferase
MTAEVHGGTLYVVSTPIGNLGDITLRALEVLKGVDLVAAEDTRTTGNLLRHFGIDRPLVSFHSHNETRRAEGLVRELCGGKSVALATDAGTPGVSDPAFALVREAVAAGVPVVPVPGASALLAALVVSGLPTDRFVFEGFLPTKKGRRSKLERLRAEERTVVIYESPFRVERTLRDLLEAVGDRPAVLARELTKKFEEVRRGSLSELLAGVRRRAPKGECVIMVAGAGRSGVKCPEPADREDDDADDEEGGGR